MPYGRHFGRAVAVGIFLVSFVSAQSPEQNRFPVSTTCKAHIPRLTQLMSEVRTAYTVGKFDAAYDISRRVVEIADTNCQGEKDKRLSIYMTVAQIQSNRRRYREAQEIYERNLLLAEEVYGEDSTDLQRYIADLLKLSVNTVGVGKYEIFALKQIDITRKKFGDQSVEAMRELVRMARFYEASGKADLADKFYLDALLIVDRLPVEEASAKESVVNRYRIFLIRQFGDEVGLQRGAELMRNRYPDFPNREKVLNGYAFSLPKPAFPVIAKNVNASGEVRVEIFIDERGFVSTAEAISGHPLLRQPAEAAAKIARFLPTYVKGKPVTVKGVIKYNFID